MGDTLTVNIPIGDIMKHILRRLLYIFREYRVTGSLNFLGLILAFMSFYSFWGLLRDLVVWDTCHEEWYSMYRVEVEGKVFGEDSVYIANLPARLVPELERVPGITAVGMQRVWDSNIYFRKGDTVVTCPYTPGCARYLSFWRRSIDFSHLKDYSVTDADTMRNVVIPESFAKEYFPNEEAVGKTLRWQVNGKDETRTVAAVYADFPTNCSVTNAIYDVYDGGELVDNTNYSYHIFVKVPQAERLGEVKERIRQSFINISDTIENDAQHQVKAHLRPIREAYFSGVDKTRDKGSYIFIVIIFMAAQIPLALAYINFMNFQLAVAPFTIKTKNTHRIFGATHVRVTFSQFAENFIFVMSAFVVAMVLVAVIDKGLHLGISRWENVTVIVYTFIAAMIISLCSSVYPAIYTSSVPLDIAMKGVPAISVTMKRMRIVKLVFQMVTSFAIVGFILSLMLYYSYIRFGYSGYDKDRIIYCSINSLPALQKKEEIRRKILSLTDVEAVSLSAFTMGNKDFYMKLSVPLTETSQNLLLTVLPVDSDYLSTLGIPLVAGHDFCASTKKQVIVNEALCQRYPSVKIGSKLCFDYDIEHEVVGVCHNMRISSLRIDNENTPMAFLLADSVMSPAHYPVVNGVLNIRLRHKADTEEVIKEINDIYHAYAPYDETFNVLSPDRNIADLYTNEYRFFFQMTILGIVYVVITLIGILSQAMFEIQFRRREIFIRRVFGATILQIMRIRLLWCVKMLSVSFVISLPLIWFLSSFALQGYFGRPIYMWLVYPLTFIVVSAIMLATIFFHGIYSLSGRVIRQ